MKTNLTYAFDEMRRRGILAKQNFKCCPEHAGPKIATEAAQLVHKGIKVKGCCFYTGADAAFKRKGLDFYLCYGPLLDFELGEIGLAGDVVGRLVVRCLAKFGVDYLWDGDPESRIMVVAASIQKMPLEKAKECKLPVEAKYQMGRLERPYWSHFSVN